MLLGGAAGSGTVGGPEGAALAALSALWADAALKKDKIRYPSDEVYDLYEKSEGKRKDRYGKRLVEIQKNYERLSNLDKGVTEFFKGNKTNKKKG